MRCVIQRVTEAAVAIDGAVKASIKTGFLVLIGVGEADDRTVADKMIKKLIGMRIFADENDKTNLSLKDVDGELLLISQFTLYADCRKGNRPSFIRAGAPDVAEALYDYIVEECRRQIPATFSGEFGADMKISLVNDGPFTIVLDSEDLAQR